MTSYCGYIALIGRPNVGKSTLLNRLLHRKLSITSKKAQTTRQNILGIQTIAPYQYVYVDTPGLHTGSKKMLHRYMNKAARQALTDVDVILFLVEALNWRQEDDEILNLIQRFTPELPCILVINKIDKIKDLSLLLPWLEAVAKKYPFKALIPLSAKTGNQVEQLNEDLKQYLPEGPYLFDSEQITDRPLRFLCAELLREKIFRACGQELPYTTTVSIESYEEEESIVKIHALILVDKESHKRMIIGEKGEKLKNMASLARLDMEKLIEKKVYLKCWCKVKAGWSDDEQMLKQLGYCP